MRQILQPIDGKELQVVDIPVPTAPPGCVVVQNHASAISPGTESYIRELAKKSLINKARSRPDHVLRVVEKLKQEGIVETLRQVSAKLDQPMPLGYSSAGIVVEVGEGVQSLRIGDRVATNGPHAEYVLVPENLAQNIPDNIEFESAAYTVLAAISLQGHRLANPGLSDRILVLGLGVIGQFSVQLGIASGAEVLAYDLNPERAQTAVNAGATVASNITELRNIVKQRTSGHGVDIVLVCAATESNEVISLAAEMARQKGKIVCVGAVGLDIPRKPFFEKELSFMVSCSYGPGRYDSRYEELGIDYPYAHVRWTERRNFESVLELISKGLLKPKELISKKIKIDQALTAYEDLQKNKNCLSVLITYSDMAAHGEQSRSLRLIADASEHSDLKTNKHPPRLAFVGAGNFAAGTLIPCFIRNGMFQPEVLVSSSGFRSASTARKYKFRNHATNLQAALTATSCDAVIIATRHGDHAKQIMTALEASKHVFVEKPLAIKHSDVKAIQDKLSALEKSGSTPTLMVGYNRRYSPCATIVQKAILQTAAPVVVNIRMNAGFIPQNHWVHDPEQGGGRLIGEACHAVDLAMYLVGATPESVYVSAPENSQNRLTEDDFVMTLTFGSAGVATIVYTASGDRAGGKERVEVFSGGMFGIIDNFKKVEIFSNGKRSVRQVFWSQKKGYDEEVEYFLNLIEQPKLRSQVACDAIFSALTCIMGLRSLREKRVVKLTEEFKD